MQALLFCLSVLLSEAIRGSRLATSYTQNISVRQRLLSREECRKGGRWEGFTPLNLHAPKCWITPVMDPQKLLPESHIP